jgi:hypothetical protein
MHDGAPCHRLTNTRRFLEVNNFRIFPWCARSPDLNPIENMRSELGNALVQEWARIPQRVIQNYITSMRMKCLAVIRAEGGHMRY